MPADAREAGTSGVASVDGADAVRQQLVARSDGLASPALGA